MLICGNPFVSAELKIPYQQILVYLIFMNLFLILLKLDRNYIFCMRSISADL